EPARPRWSASPVLKTGAPTRTRTPPLENPIESRERRGRERADPNLRTEFDQRSLILLHDRFKVARFPADIVEGRHAVIVPSSLVTPLPRCLCAPPVAHSLRRIPQHAGGPRRPHRAHGGDPRNTGCLVAGLRRPAQRRRPRKGRFGPPHLGDQTRRPGPRTDELLPSR